jgi:hypothetical protein
MRRLAWQSTVLYKDFLLHDEVRIAADGRVHSVQWLALPSASTARVLAERLDAFSLSVYYFATIERQLRTLVRVQLLGAGVRLNALGIPLLCLANQKVRHDQHLIEVGYTIDGGMLDATPQEKGRFCMKLFEWDLNEWRLAVEITRYRPRAVALQSSLLYRLTQSAVHRWVTFDYLRWCVDHISLLAQTRG